MLFDPFPEHSDIPGYSVPAEFDERNSLNYRFAYLPGKRQACNNLWFMKVIHLNTDFHEH
jgi:hypothetical protein